MRDWARRAAERRRHDGLRRNVGGPRSPHDHTADDARRRRRRGRGGLFDVIQVFDIDIDTSAVDDARPFRVASNSSKAAYTKRALEPFLDGGWEG